MSKFDRIFFAACGLFVLGLIFALLGQNLALLFVVGAYLLRPTLHAFGLAGRFEDERQIQIHSRSGNIAFIAIVLAMVGFALAHLSQGEQPEELYAILTIGVVARAITGLLMGGEYRKAASIIIIVAGTIVALFVFISEGASTAGLFTAGIALSLAALGVVALRFPRAVGSILFVIALGMVVRFGLYEFQARNLGAWIVVACFLIAALALYRGREDDLAEDKRPSKLPRSLMLAGGTLALLVLMIFLSVPSKDPARSTPGDTLSSGRTVTEPVEIQDVSCIGRLEFYQNGKLKSCALARLDTLSGQPLDEGTVVAFTSDGVLDWCFLQRDTEIQGHLCKGEGHEFMTCFHPSGKLRLVWLGRAEDIQGVPCAEYSFWAEVFGGGGGTYFWENGNLRRCRVSRDFTLEGRSFSKGDVVTFDQDGKMRAQNGS